MLPHTYYIFWRPEFYVMRQSKLSIKFPDFILLLFIAPNIKKFTSVRNGFFKSFCTLEALRKAQLSCKTFLTATCSVLLLYSLQKACLIAAALPDILVCFPNSLQAKTTGKKLKCFSVKAG